MAEEIGLAFVGMAPLRLAGIYLHAAHEISDTTSASPGLSTGLIVVLLHGLSLSSRGTLRIPSLQRRDTHHEPDTLSEASTASGWSVAHAQGPPLLEEDWKHAGSTGHPHVSG